MYIRKALLMLFFVALMSLFLVACGNSPLVNITVSSGEEVEETEQAQGEAEEQEEEEEEQEEDEESEDEPVNQEAPEQAQDESEESQVASAPRAPRTGTNPAPRPRASAPIQEASRTLVGTWLADDLTEEITFGDDGWGYLDDDLMFVWEANADNSVMELSFLELDEWLFDVIEEDGEFYLVLENLHDANQSFVYIFTGYVDDFSNADYYSILFGGWAWVDDLSYEYRFFSDNTGDRGIGANYEVFAWGADDETGELVFIFDFDPEPVTFNITLEGDTLTVINDNNQQTVYNRVN